MDSGSIPPSLAAVEEAALAETVTRAGPEAREAEAELYRRLAPRARLYGLRHLRDPEAAADLAQDVLLMTLERLREGRVREPDRLGSYVLGMCRMIVRDRRRAHERHERLLVQYASSIPAPDIAVAPRLDVRRLQLCMDRLALRDRTVIVLAFGVERTTAEIAEELGVTPAHVRVLRHRALGRLRGCVEGKEDS